MRKTSACSCCFCCYSSSGVIHLLLNGGIQGGGIFFSSKLHIQEFYGELFKKKSLKRPILLKLCANGSGEVLVLGNFNLLSVATHISIFCREVYSLISSA